MIPSKVRLFGVGAVALVPIVGIVGLGGSAGAASGSSGIATLTGDKIILTSWSLTAGSGGGGGFHATGTTTPNTFAVTIRSAATASGTNYVASQLEITIPAARCSITVGTVILTKVSANHYTGSATVTTSDYTAACISKPTGMATISLT